MSYEMDSRDLWGALVGAGVASATLGARDARSPVEVGQHFSAVLRPAYLRVFPALREYAGVDQELLDSVPDGVVELLNACNSFDDDLNLYLNLYAVNRRDHRQFFVDGRLDRRMIFRCLIEQGRNVAHAAVRVRPQSDFAGAVGDYWTEIARFLSVIFGSDHIGRALSTSTIVDAVSDILFYGSDYATRVDDPSALKRYDQVFEELRRVDFEDIASRVAEPQGV